MFTNRNSLLLAVVMVAGIAGNCFADTIKIKNDTQREVTCSTLEKGNRLDQNASSQKIAPKQIATITFDKQKVYALRCFDDIKKDLEVSAYLTLDTAYVNSQQGLAGHFDLYSYHNDNQFTQDDDDNSLWSFQPKNLPKIIAPPSPIPPQKR